MRNRTIDVSAFVTHTRVTRASHLNCNNQVYNMDRRCSCEVSWRCRAGVLIVDEPWHRACAHHACLLAAAWTPKRRFIQAILALAAISTLATRAHAATRRAHSLDLSHSRDKARVSLTALWLHHTNNLVRDGCSLRLGGAAGGLTNTREESLDGSPKEGVLLARGG